MRRASRSAATRWCSPVRHRCRPFCTYLNYKPTPLDNISWRGEFYDDKQGQRTGTKTRYVETGLGWQHWFSPQIEIRPEFTYYKSLDAFAFNGNANLGIPATRTSPSSVRRTSSFTSEAGKGRGGLGRRMFRQNNSIGDNDETNSSHHRLARCAGPAVTGTRLPICLTRRRRWSRRKSDDWTGFYVGGLGEAATATTISPTRRAPPALRITRSTIPRPEAWLAARSATTSKAATTWSVSKPMPSGPASTAAMPRSSSA